MIVKGTFKRIRRGHFDVLFDSGTNAFPTNTAEENKNAASILPGHTGHRGGRIDVHKGRFELRGHRQMGLLVLYKVHWDVLLQQAFECFTPGIIAMRGREQPASNKAHAGQAQKHDEAACTMQGAMENK